MKEENRNTSNPTTATPSQYITSRQKQIIVIGITLFFLLILTPIFILLLKKSSSLTTPPKPTQLQTVIEKKGTITINPSQATLHTNSSKNTFYVDFDAQEIQIESIEFKIKYDPTFFNTFDTNSFMDTTSALNQSLQFVENSIDNNKGIAKMKFRLKKDNYPQKGKARLAEITFKTAKKLSSTKISLSDIKFTSPELSTIFTPLVITNSDITTTSN